MSKQVRILKSKIKRAKKDIRGLKRYVRNQNIVTEAIGDRFNKNDKHRALIVKHIEENHALICSNDNKIDSLKKQINACKVWNAFILVILMLTICAVIVHYINLGG